LFPYFLYEYLDKPTRSKLFYLRCYSYTTLVPLFKTRTLFMRCLLQ